MLNMFLIELLAQRKLVSLHIIAKLFEKSCYQAKWKDSAFNFKIYWVSIKIDLKASEEWTKTYEIFPRH